MRNLRIVSQIQRAEHTVRETIIAFTMILNKKIKKNNLANANEVLCQYKLKRDNYISTLFYTVK